MADEREYDALMEIVCVRLGWCGCVTEAGQPLHVDDFIPEQGEVTAEQFAEWVILADGIDPAADPTRWQPSKEAIRAAFIECMGGDVADARRLQWASVRD